MRVVLDEAAVPPSGEGVQPSRRFRGAPGEEGRVSPGRPAVAVSVSSVFGWWGEIRWPAEWSLVTRVGLRGEHRVGGSGAASLVDGWAAAGARQRLKREAHGEGSRSFMHVMAGSVLGWWGDYRSLRRCDSPPVRQRTQGQAAPGRRDRTRPHPVTRRLWELRRCRPVRERAHLVGEAFNSSRRRGRLTGTTSSRTALTCRYAEVALHAPVKGLETLLADDGSPLARTSTLEVSRTSFLACRPRRWLGPRLAPPARASTVV